MWIKLRTRQGVNSIALKKGPKKQARKRAQNGFLKKEYVSTPQNPPKAYTASPEKGPENAPEKGPEIAKMLLNLHDYQMAVLYELTCTYHLRLNV